MYVAMKSREHVETRYIELHRSGRMPSTSNTRQKLSTAWPQMWSFTSISRNAAYLIRIQVVIFERGAMQEGGKAWKWHVEHFIAATTVS
jgi:hypothetical protein